ncbi:MAG: histidinol dehydrogenase [Ignavibacteriae bacterium]|nr:histidinol dehydrogenase [Ignavibacteriota bacterium]
MKTIIFNKLTQNQKTKLLQRPSIDMSKTYQIVQPILVDIKKNGLKSVLSYSKKFDGFSGKQIRVTESEFIQSEKIVSNEFKKAVKIAVKNITKFHKLQFPKKYSIENMKGVNCSREFRAIENVGLYIPGGTAILPSTLMMLAIPAKIAGCKRIVVCSPTNKNITAEVLYVAKFLGINEFYKVGGAQSIGLMAYGTNKINKVDKIFGPGNQFVAAAKALVSIDPNGCAIDMIAGPSEVLVIADKSANPKFIASDLLSQAEHGNDSQVILCTTNKDFCKKVIDEINKQTENLERKDFVKKSLENSFVIVFENIDTAIEFSNSYAPEHLILNFKNAKSKLSNIHNAGSVFIGQYSPESVGDYASGTNHSLPTYGYAKSIGGVSVEQFMKGITFQELSKDGLRNISKTVIELANKEKLQAHANAVKIRLEQ